jgi:hypothetical protein
MPTARDIMTPDATFCRADTSAVDAARTMAGEGIGAMTSPSRGASNTVGRESTPRVLLEAVPQRVTSS